MRLLGDDTFRYIRDHEPGWRKESFFIPDYSEQGLKKIDNKDVLIEQDRFHIPSTPPSTAQR